MKILDIDPKAVVARLKELGAEKIEAGLIKVTAFDTPEMKAEHSFVRIRTFGHRTEMVLKRPVPAAPSDSKGFKVREEIQTNVDDFDVAVRLFEALGMDRFADHEKFRASYRLGDIRFEFDKYPDVPWFVEVEAPDEKTVTKGVGLLGFTMADTTDMHGGDVCRKYGHQSDDFTFKDFDESPDYDHLFP